MAKGKVVVHHAWKKQIFPLTGRTVYTMKIGPWQAWVHHDQGKSGWVFTLYPGIIDSMTINTDDALSALVRVERMLHELFTNAARMLG
jgi:hypothetical protein